MNTLLTPWEAVSYGPVAQEYNTADMAPYIRTVEMKVFRECLSLELYKEMQEKKVEYSNLPQWDKTATYSENDTVIFFGSAIISLKDINNDLPGSDAPPEDPNYKSWDYAQKFDSDCFNNLWELHLRSYLAFEISLKSIRKSTHRATAKGLTEMTDSGASSRNVSRTSLIDWKKEIREDALDLLQEMKYWIIDTYKEGSCDAFGTIPFVVKSCDTGHCNIAAKRGRRMYFKR